MHLSSFGTSVDRALEEALVGVLNGKMFGSGTKKWFVKKQRRQPHLFYEKVFSLGEYKEILSQDTSKKRTEVFLDQLSSKGPAAFCSFCSVLEEVHPHLLTCFLLDGQDGVLGRAKKGGLLFLSTTKWSSPCALLPCTPTPCLTQVKTTLIVTKTFLRLVSRDRE
ncbi:hypothetical protein WMY93_022997 [Mugilogobius chulae]|uniref:CARD domain-containing protein n=1 Tax=Mugilogobius chulae TaxID=88201 RepID=A0AAW0N9V9_9GOBI